MSVYGFHLDNDREVQIEADTMTEAIAIVEEQTGCFVMRGSQLS